MSVRLSIRRDGEFLKLSVDGIPNEGCHLEIHPQSGADDDLRFELSIRCDAGPVGAENNLDSVPDHRDINDVVDGHARDENGLSQGKADAGGGVFSGGLGRNVSHLGNLHNPGLQTALNALNHGGQLQRNMLPRTSDDPEAA